MHQLKLEHTIRVAADARAIAQGMDWLDEEVNLAEAVGLCHDVARFPQFKQYGTFSDAQSVDHGDLGSQTLENEGLLDGIADEPRNLILHSVQYHNKKDLPRTLTAHEERHLRLIRDADRLDIFFICWHTVESGWAKDHPELMMNIEYDGLPSDEILDQFERGETINYAHLKSMADRFILQLSWIHDLSYASTKRLVSERRIVEKFVDILPVKTDRMLRCFETTIQFLDQA